MLPAVEPVRVLKPSSDISGNAFYTGTEVSLTFTSKTLSIWASVTSASVLGIAGHCHRIASYARCRRIQLCLPATDDVNGRTFCCEQPSCFEANSTTPASELRSPVLASASPGHLEQEPDPLLGFVDEGLEHTGGRIVAM